MKARDAALQVLKTVENQGGYANLILDEYLKRSDLDAADRRLVTQLVNGTVRYRLRLEYVLNQFLKRGLKSLPPLVALVLKLAAYQLLFLQRVPAYAVIDEAVRQTARLRFGNLKGVVNGALRELERNRQLMLYPDRGTDLVNFLAVYYSHPAWIVERWLGRWGEEYTERLLDFDNTSPALTLRTNTLKTSREELIQKLTAEGFKVRAGTLTPWSIVVEDMPFPVRDAVSYREGLFYIQDEASMLVAAAMKPEARWKVIDGCAGVGGKSTMLAQLMDDRGEVIAIEYYANKISLLKANCQRLGIKSIHPVCGDLLAYRGEQARGVLLDAPCSGLGVLRRRADARYRRGPADLLELARLQARMIDHCADLVERAGYLVYATCTLEPEENEQVVEAFLAKHPDFEPCAVSDAWPWLNGRGIKPHGPGYLIDPLELNSDGMFVARMRRK